MNVAKNLVKPMLIGSFALAAALSSTVWAQQTHTAMTPKQINSQYDAAMKHCKTMKGNEHDVCEKEAKARRDSAKADAKADKKTAEARHDAIKEKRDSGYSVAKEKCDAMSGDAKDQCVAQAKTKYGK